MKRIILVLLLLYVHVLITRAQTTQLEMIKLRTTEITSVTITDNMQGQVTGNINWAIVKPHASDVPSLAWDWGSAITALNNNVFPGGIVNNYNVNNIQQPAIATVNLQMDQVPPFITGTTPTTVVTCNGGDKELVIRFFKVTVDLPAATLRVIEELKRRNLQLCFVGDIVRNVGYPIWDKAIVQNNSGNNLTSVFIPLAMTDSNYVDAYIETKVNREISMKLFRAVDYQQYFPGGIDSSITDYSVCESYAKRFMIMDNLVYGSELFKITDPLIFKEGLPDSIKAEVTVNATMSKTEFKSVYCYWFELDDGEGSYYNNGQLGSDPPGGGQHPWVIDGEPTYELVCDFGGGGGSGGGISTGGTTIGTPPTNSSSGSGNNNTNTTQGWTTIVDTISCPTDSNFKVTKAMLQAINQRITFHNSAEKIRYNNNCDSSVKYLNMYMKDYGITNRNALACVLAIASQETDLFLNLIEDSTFSANNIQVQWGKNLFPDVIVNNYVNCLCVFDRAYAEDCNKLQHTNCNEASKDGSKYRGRGLFHMTHKDSYWRFDTYYKAKYNDYSFNFETNPDVIGTNYRLAVLAALWELSIDKSKKSDGTDKADSRNPLKQALKGNMNAVINAINKNDTNKDDKMDKFRTAKKLLCL